MPEKRNRAGYSILSSILTINTLRRMAGPVYFGRGEGYFESRLVKGLVEFEGRITAAVTGTERYEVSLWLEAGELGHSCTCPLGEEGEFCKHCVAVGLEWLDQQKGGRGRKNRTTVDFDALRRYLLAQKKQALADIILEHAGKDDRLRHMLFLRAARTPSRGLDIDAFCAAIDHTLDFEGYVDYRSVRYYARGLEDVVDSIADLLKQGYAKEVMELSEYALSALEVAIEQVDDSDGYMGEILNRLEEIHLDACKMARLGGTGPAAFLPGAQFPLGSLLKRGRDLC